MMYWSESMARAEQAYLNPPDAEYCSYCGEADCSTLPEVSCQDCDLILASGCPSGNKVKTVCLECEQSKKRVRR